MIRELLEDLAREVVREFEGRRVGHCLRVDGLEGADAERLVELVRAEAEGKFGCFLLARERTRHVELRPDQAVEARNDTGRSLCIVVPPQVQDILPESLANAFAVFDTQVFLEQRREALIEELRGEVREAVRAVGSYLRGRAKVSVEDFIAFLLDVRQEPRAERVGRSLWRVGLVPDLGGGFVARLKRNREAVDEIARPGRPQSSALERLQRARLAPGDFTSRLAHHLSGRRLYDTENWQRPIAMEPAGEQFSFDKWRFPDQPQPELEQIVIQPFVDKDGKVYPYCHLQPGSGGALVGKLGRREKVTVKWTSEPARPKGVAHWRLELIPSESYHGRGYAASLPSRQVPAGTGASHTARLTLDLEAPEELGVRVVQVRVTALDQDDLEVLDPEGRQVEGLSEEFWLKQAGEEPDGGDDGDGPVKKRAEISLPLARLEMTTRLHQEESELEESGAVWKRGEYYYFHVRLNRREEKRVAASQALVELQDRVMQERGCGWFFAEVGPDTPVTCDQFQREPLPEELSSSPEWQEFFGHRERALKELAGRGTRGRVESLAWDAELVGQVRRYARSYRDLLEKLISQGLKESLVWALRLDSVQLSICHPGGRREKAVVVLPLHPLRLLWYGAYALLLEHWGQRVKEFPCRARRRCMNLEGIRRLGPENLPAFVPDAEGNIYVFAQNVGLYTGIALPVETREPARVISQITTMLGLPAELGQFSDLPVERLSRAVTAYMDLHRHQDALRLNVVNPGDGTFVAEGLLEALKGRVSEEGSSGQVSNLDVLAHCCAPLPITLPGFDRLREWVYSSEWPKEGSHLQPQYQLAIRDARELQRIPGGDVHLTLLFDYSVPSIRVLPRTGVETSASVYGLLTRLCTSFESTDSRACWVHQIRLPKEGVRERHPVQPQLSGELVEGQSAYLTGVRCLLGAEDGEVSLVVELDPERRNQLDQVHDRSDWVCVIDRYMGVDAFDAPRDPYLSQISRKYLLDYAPDFIEGLSRRMVLTTAWREEVEELMRFALEELGFEAITESVGEALDHLKSISARLALQLVHRDARGMEAAALAAAVAWMRSSGELGNAILVPVDAHPEIFGEKVTTGRPESEGEDGLTGGSGSRCDLLQVRLHAKRLEVCFIEVKGRTKMGAASVDQLAERMCDQMEAAESRFRYLFFNAEERVDRVVELSRLASILRFYAYRTWRHGLFGTRGDLETALQRIEWMESGALGLRASRRGYVVHLGGKGKEFEHRGAHIRVLSAEDFQARTVFRSSTGGDARPETPGAVERCLSEEGATGAGASAQVQAGGSPGSPDWEVFDQVRRAGEVRVVLGTSVDQELVWGPSVVGSPHIFVLGMPGQGKSWTVTRLLCEAGRQGLPALVLDFHGQFSSPESPYQRLLQPKVWELTEGLPFSPFDAVGNADAGARFWKTNSFAIAEIFQYVFRLGDIQRGLIYEAMVECYKDAGFEAGEISRLPTMAALEQKIRQLENRQGVKNVLVRCKQVFDFRLFREDCTPDSSQLLRASAGGLVVDVHRQGLEHVQIAAAAFLLRKLYKDMFRWGEATEPRLLLVLDEAHRVARDVTLPRIMKEGRKFGVVVVTASQSMTDFHPEVLANSGTKIVFRTNYPMSKKVAGFLRGHRNQDLSRIVEQLQVGVAMAQTPEMSHAWRVQMGSPPVVQ